MALLDYLFGSGGLLPSYQVDPERIGAAGAPWSFPPSIFQNNQSSPLDNAQWPAGPVGAPGVLPPNARPAQGPAPQFPQAPQGPGLMDRFTAGFQGALNSGSPMGAIGNLIGGLSSGVRTDAAGAQQAGVSGMLNALVASGQITPTQARFLAANPKSWEELGKAMINVPVQIAPDGTIIQSRPFGQLNIPGAVPISERGEVVNPDQSKSPAFFVKPNLTNQSGSVVTPGVPGAPRTQTTQPPVGRGRPTGPITTSSPQATKESEAVGGGLAEDYTKINQRSAAATKTLGTLQRMSQLSDKAYEGAAAPAQQFLRSTLASFGLPSNTVAAGEEFTSLANKLTLDAQNGSLGAGVSNADVLFISNINPTMAQTVAGRKEIIATMTALAKRDQDVAREAVRYRSENGTMDGFQNHIAKWAEQRPMFNGRDKPAGSSVLRPGDAGYKIIGVR